MQSRVQLFSSVQISRMVRRIAFEVIESNKSADNLIIVGILNRGARLARLIADSIGGISNLDVPVRNIDVSAYRDDSHRTAKVPANGSAGALDVTDKDVLLVDDVLYTGRTVRAALDAVVDLGRPKTIQLAVLVDRGHREFPIEPTFVGRRVQTKYREHVEVVLDGDPSVFVEE
ncbi:MAG: bifunctional pyr operon transcriptional regulator/uracil phosphoribosyltransferase PyrR [Rhodothermales bacterium]|nr:bifunctional pyr operon transcriptional regulator/uracil phosphoribosyltransferase PyrR [Rhodothermales bacterium]